MEQRKQFGGVATPRGGRGGNGNRSRDRKRERGRNIGGYRGHQLNYGYYDEVIMVINS